MVADSRSWPRSEVSEDVEHDFQLWAADQASKLLAGDLAAVDKIGLARALQALAEQNRADARGLIRQATESLILAEHGSTEQRGRRMAEAVLALQKLQPMLSPSLGCQLASEWGRLYVGAAHSASETLRDQGGDPADIPRQAPWSWEEVFGPDGSVPF